MISKQSLNEFLGKKVFIRIDGEPKTQVGYLKQIGDDFFLESHHQKTLLNPDFIARITQDRGGY